MDNITGLNINIECFSAIKRTKIFWKMDTEDIILSEITQARKTNVLSDMDNAHEFSG